MRKFLFAVVGMLMVLAAQAAPTYDVGQQQSDQVVLMQTDAQDMMVVDFIYVAPATDMVVSATGTEYTIYEAMPMEVRTQVFDLTMPVFRLCIHKANAFKSNLYSGWRGLNSNPPSQYDRA